MTAYSIVLGLHSWLRWVVLGAGLLAAYRGYAGWSGQRVFGRADHAAGAGFVGVMFLELFAGLGLFLRLSPWGLSALQRSEALHDPTTRFFGVEHGVILIIAVVVARVGRSLSTKRPDDTQKHKTAFIYYGIALLLVLLLIPWGLWNPARPLFRF